MSSEINLPLEEKNVREIMIFAILAECTCHQINLIEGLEWQKRPREVIKHLVKNSENILREIRKGLNEDAIYAIEEMHDHYHMVVRLASQVPAEDSEKFILHMRQFLKQYETPQHILDNA